MGLARPGFQREGSDLSERAGIDSSERFAGGWKTPSAMLLGLWRELVMNRSLKSDGSSESVSVD